MKKGIVGVLMLVSVMAFARGGDGQGTSYNGQNGMQRNNKQELRNPRYNNLTDEQKEKIEKVRKLRDKRIEDGRKTNLIIKEKGIGIQKEMLEDKVDWIKVEKIQKEIGALKIEQNIIRLKEKKEIETILGEDIFLMRKNNQRQGGNNKDKRNKQGISQKNQKLGQNQVTKMNKNQRKNVKNKGNKQRTQMNNNQKSESPIYNDLTDAQKLKVEKVRKLRSGIREDGKKSHLNIIEKNIGIQKEMLEDKINWTKVEKIQKEIEALKTEQKIIRLKAKQEIEAIIGEDTFLIRRNNQEQGKKLRDRGNNRNDRNNRGNKQGR